MLCTFLWTIENAWIVQMEPKKKTMETFKSQQNTSNLQFGELTQTAIQGISILIFFGDRCISEYAKGRFSSAPSASHTSYVSGAVNSVGSILEDGGETELDSAVIVFGVDGLRLFF